MFTDKQHAPPVTARFSNTSAGAGPRQGGEALRVLKGHRPRDSTTISTAQLPLRADHVEAVKEMATRLPLVDRPMNTLKSGHAVATPAAAVEPPLHAEQRSGPVPAQRVQHVQQAHYQPEAAHRGDREVREVREVRGQEAMQQQQKRSQAVLASQTANSPTTSSRIPQHICTHNVPYDVCKLRKLHLKGIAAEMEACFEQFAEADGPEMLQELQKESRRLVEIRNALSGACKGGMDGTSQRTSYRDDGATYHQLGQVHEQPMAGTSVSSQPCHLPPPQPHQSHRAQAPFQVHQYVRSEQGQLNESSVYNQQPSFQQPPVGHSGYLQPLMQPPMQPPMQPSFQQPSVQQHQQQQQQQQQYYQPQQQYSAFGSDAGAQDLPPPALLPSAQPAEFQSNSHDRIDASNDPKWKRTDFEWSQVCCRTGVFVPWICPPLACFAHRPVMIRRQWRMRTETFSETSRSGCISRP